MYTSASLLLLAIAGTQAFSLAERAPQDSSAAPGIQQGWSLQSDSVPAGGSSCGGGSYCPAGLFCNSAKNAEVASCCSSSANCVGAVEGAPLCADSSWNLFIGNDGNGFCCEVGKVGVVDTQAKTVGCVDSGSVGSQSTAFLTKSGFGAAPTKSASSASSSASSTATSTVSSASSSSSGSQPSSTSTSTNAGSAKAVGLGLVAAGLMAVAAL